jgi:hypothetical protein
MEAVIMKDIMNMATILIRNPKSIEKECLGLFEEENASNDNNTESKPSDQEKLLKFETEGREFAKLVSLKKKLDEVDDPEQPDPVHPVDVFDMIVGTSTGK